jgi:hypothetical protein
LCPRQMAENYEMADVDDGPGRSRDHLLHLPASSYAIAGNSAVVLAKVKFNALLGHLLGKVQQQEREISEDDAVVR